MEVDLFIDALAWKLEGSRVELDCLPALLLLPSFTLNLSLCCVLRHSTFVRPFVCASSDESANTLGNRFQI